MKHVKLFEEHFSQSEKLFDGAIPVYPPGNPFKPEGSIQWTGVVPHTTKWKEQGQSFVLVVDVDYDMYTADPQFRSKANGTWSNKELPLFSSKYPRYKEVDFDLVAVEENTEKPREHWLRIADKNGVEFRVHPFHILDIQKGASVKDGIFAGDVYLIKDMRGKVINLKNDVVELKLQDGSKKNIPLAEWKKSSYTKIEESRKASFDHVNEDIEFDLPRSKSLDGTLDGTYELKKTHVGSLLTVKIDDLAKFRKVSKEDMKKMLSENIPGFINDDEEMRIPITALLEAFILQMMKMN